MTIEFILSMMIYCNFDSLQTEFSKTYRMYDGKMHCNFYFLGKNLKISVSTFGTYFFHNGDITKLYHGIGEKLAFPTYGIGEKHGLTMDVDRDVCIYSPLSTTTALEVALNFTNFNEGLIVEFGPTLKTSPKFLEMSWLSDFAYEHEYLFIQSTDPIHINNITDVKHNIEYNIMLQSLRNIEKIVTCDGDFKFGSDVFLKKSLEIAIIYDQLSRSISQCKEFSSLTDYARQMCHVYFQQVSFVNLDFSTLKQKCIGLYECLFDVKKKTVDFSVLNCLFPKLKTIYIFQANINDNIMDDVLKILSCKHLFKSLKEIRFGVNNNCRHCIMDLISTKEASFRKINVYLSTSMRYHTLHVHKCNMQTFVEHVIGCFGTEYFIDDNKEIDELTQRLITAQLIRCKDQNFPHNEEQMIFNEYCKKVTHIQVNLGHVASNKQQCLHSLFYRLKYGWINLELINLLFTNITNIHISKVHLCSYILDDILFHLRNAETNIYQIKLTPTNINAIAKVISTYRKQFDSIGYWLANREFDKYKDLNKIIYEEEAYRLCIGWDVLFIKKLTDEDRRDMLNFEIDAYRKDFLQ
eukprot:116445_1